MTVGFDDDLVGEATRVTNRLYGPAPGSPRAERRRR